MSKEKNKNNFLNTEVLGQVHKQYESFASDIFISLKNMIDKSYDTYLKNKGNILYLVADFQKMRYEIQCLLETINYAVLVGHLKANQENFADKCNRKIVQHEQYLYIIDAKRSTKHTISKSIIKKVNQYSFKCNGRTVTPRNMRVFHRCGSRPIASIEELFVHLRDTRVSYIEVRI